MRLLKISDDLRDVAGPSNRLFLYQPLCTGKEQPGVEVSGRRLMDSDGG
jgi:hypothetical protein